MIGKLIGNFFFGDLWHVYASSCDQRGMKTGSVRCAECGKQMERAVNMSVRRPKLPAVPASVPPTPGQLAFDELDTPLRETTFVVVDLETTGTSPDTDDITEIGAVKVRGGQVLGEFVTFVDPGRTIPPEIVHRTGITTAMVCAAPAIDAVLPGFLEFADDAVLVAHNARFDLGFLRCAANRCDMPWPISQTLCTVRLARRVLGRDEASSVRLGALAHILGARTTPTHRALDDARATVDVLHALIERVGNQGVHSLTELVDYTPQVSAQRRAKRGMAADLPAAPGVYLFRGPTDEVLYVGTAVNLRRRVRTYFTGSETRSRMREMVALAVRIDHVVCAHGLEAEVRELRLLGAHRPPYNRRSTSPRRGWWVVLTDEAFPRVTIVRDPVRAAVGPFGSRAAAAEVAATIAEFCALRTCTTRLSAHAKHSCVPEAVGGCPAAVVDSTTDQLGYAPAVAAARALLAGTDDAVVQTIVQRIDDHARAECFESAARLRDRTAGMIRALHRTQRLAAVAYIAELVVAAPDGSGGWEFAVVRYGRLAGAGVSARAVAPMPVVEQIAAAAETVIADRGDCPEVAADTDPSGAPGAQPPPLRGAPAGEVGVVVRWLERPGIRVVRTTAGYCMPRFAAARWLEWATAAQDAARSAAEATASAADA